MRNQKQSKRNHLSMIAMAIVVLAGMIGAAVQPAAAASNSTRSVSIVSVLAGKSVTIDAKGFPANTDVTVRMGQYGTKAASGTIAGTAVTASNGTLKGTYTIPDALKSQAKIALRVETTAKPSQFAYNWFANVTTSPTSTSSAPTSTTSTGNIVITDVNEDKDVTFKAAGAPAGAKLAVWFDWETSSGALKGQQSGTVKVGSDGTILATVKIPPAAKDRPSLRLRLQGLSGSSYLIYKWFTNADIATSGGSSSGSTGGLPYIVVTAVSKDNTVTIKAYKFPQGEYVVRMDSGGSSAKNGIKVDTIEIKENKTYSATFDIPDDLAGEDTITIRIQSVDDAKTFAYTTFDNVTQ